MENKRVQDWLRAVECIPRLIEAVKARQSVYETCATNAGAVFDSLKCHPLAPTIMRLHWIDGLEWWKVAQAVGYSERVVMRIAAAAVAELGEILPDAEQQS